MTDTAPTLLLSASDLARELRCSKRHVERLMSSGALPSPVRLGRSTRWSRDLIARWIAEGCPSQG